MGVLLLLDCSLLTKHIEQEVRVKSREEIMNILEAFDLTGSFRDAGELAGCSHHTVARYVAKRDAGELVDEGPERRERIIDPFLAKAFFRIRDVPSRSSEDRNRPLSALP